MEQSPPSMVLLRLSAWLYLNLGFVSSISVGWIYSIDFHSSSCDSTATTLDSLEQLKRSLQRVRSADQIGALDPRTDLEALGTYQSRTIRVHDKPEKKSA
ncbi:unnamed protein product [Rhizoctonia solani]|uniref:Uncharacterized protein n=1 Tax=Rhizoctonia solani TaxID=456999 RepID=A0A8H2XUJ6_9AGAM|nr:unnamed protein product [Rhizoctonia solani]